MSTGDAPAAGEALMVNRVVRVTVPLPGGGTSVGTAFPIARLTPSPERSWNTLLLTARHVICPKDMNAPMPPPQISLDFPATSIPLLKKNDGEAPFTAVLVMDGARPPEGEPEVPEDWALLGATLPDVVVPFAWGILEASEVQRAMLEAAPVKCWGAGYPTTGLLNNYKVVGGKVKDAGGFGTDVYLAMAVDASDNLNSNPAGFSGGPIAIGEVVTGLVVTSIALGGGVVGYAEVGGTRHAIPLQPIMARVAETFSGLATPCPILHPPADDDLKQLCLAAHAFATDATAAGTLEALDGACAKVLGELSGLPSGLVTDLRAGNGKAPRRHTFVLAVQRLLQLPKGARSPLERMFRRLAEPQPSVRERFKTLLVGNVVDDPPLVQALPVAAAPPAVVLDVTWADPQDHKKVNITLRERSTAGLLTKGPSREAEATAQLVIDACAALLQPWLSQLGEELPVEIWAPFELADIAFDTAELRGGEDETDPVGALAPLTVRVRLDGPLIVPDNVAKVRAAALTTLTVPLAALPGPMSQPPDDDPASVLLDSIAADADVWRAYARNHGKLVLVAIATTPSLGTVKKLAKAVVRGGVPVVAWQRGSADHLAPLLRSPVPPSPLPRRLFDYRNVNRKADFTVVVSPPGEPLPVDDLLSTL